MKQTTDDAALLRSTQATERVERARARVQVSVGGPLSEKDRAKKRAARKRQRAARRGQRKGHK